MLIILGLIVLSHLVILSKLVFLPYPEFFVYPYLTNNGLIPYKQIFDQHFPGLMFLPINLSNLGFHTPTDARIWQFGVVIIIQILIFVVANYIFKSKLKAIYTNILFLIWQPFFEGWVLWIDSFLPVFYLSSFYFLLRGEDSKNYKYYLYSGLIFGIATVFKQVVIPLVILIVVYLIILKKLKAVKYFLIGYIPIPACLVIYIFLKGYFKEFWYWAVTFNMTIFAQFGRKFATFGELTRSGFMFGFGFLGIFLTKNKSKILLSIFILGSLVAAYARFDLVHLQPALPFVTLATIYFFSSLNKKLKLAFLGVYLAISIYFLRTFYISHLGSKVFFFDKDTYQIAEEIMKLTSPNEKIFIFGASPHLYQLTNTLPAGDIFVFQFPWFIYVTENKLLAAVQRDRPKIVVSDRSVTIQGQKIVEYAKVLDKYLEANYHQIYMNGTTRILQINEY